VEEPHVKFKGEFHQLDDGGINPRPKSGRVPIWFGGHAEATFRRTAQYGDGFMPLAYPAGRRGTQSLRQAAHDDPCRGARSQIRGSRSLGLARHRRRGRLAQGNQLLEEAGVTHVNAHTSYVSAHHKRIAGKSYDDHLSAITRYRAAVKDLL
jgi:hypothetical protein